MRRSGRIRRYGICLLATHPLVLAELQRYLAPLQFKIISRQLRLLPGIDFYELRLPVAAVYILDSHSLGLACEGLIATIRSRHPRRRVIVLVGRIDRMHCFPLLRLGVKGLIPYSEVPRKLLRAVRFVAKGGAWVPRRLMEKYLEMLQSEQRPARAASRTKVLSRREREVLELLLRNLSNKEIATTLNISESTVKFHMSNIMSRFGVQRRTDIILQFLQETPISPGPR